MWCFAIRKNPPLLINVFTVSDEEEIPLLKADLNDLIHECLSLVYGADHRARSICFTGLKSDWPWAQGGVIHSQETGFCWCWASLSTQPGEDVS
jgi:hypothetical protein